MRVSNPYSGTMFNADRFGRVVAELQRHMPALMKRHGFDTIAVTGKSGMALGFAVAAAVPGLHIVSVRKGETSHGDLVEGGGNEFRKYAFFDDFVCSGSTRDRVHNELCRKARSLGVAEPRRCLTISYETAFPASGYDTRYNGDELRDAWHVGEWYSLPKRTLSTF